MPVAEPSRIPAEAGIHSQTSEVRLRLEVVSMDPGLRRGDGHSIIPANPVKAASALIHEVMA